MSRGPSPGKALDTPRLPLGIGSLATLNWKGKGVGFGGDLLFSLRHTYAHTCTHIQACAHTPMHMWWEEHRKTT